MRNITIVLLAVISIGLTLTGCFTDYGPVAAEPEPLLGPTVETHVQVGDRLTVTIYDEPNLSGVYEVNPSGYVNLPLIGSVPAVGLPANGLEREIMNRYGGLLKEPRVTIAVVEYRPIYMFGEVLKPGAYPYRPGLNALTAVTEAGGLTYRGSRSTVLIQRAGQQTWNEYPLVSSVTILPGDLIRIPERYF